MAVKLSATLNVASEQLRVLQNIVGGISSVPARYQPMVAELVVMRLFSIWEQSISEIAGKLACGATYTNGVNPALLTAPSRSLISARGLFESFGRARRASPNWSKASFVSDTVRYVIDPADHFVSAVRNHGSTINDVRVIRNLATHRNASARIQFKQLVKSKLGGYLRLTPGQFLLTSRLSPALLDKYVGEIRVILLRVSAGP